MQFSEAQVKHFRDLLTGQKSDALINYMFRKVLNQPVDDVAPDIRALAIEAGWMDEKSGDLIGLGHAVADSLREYTFWMERNRNLPCEGRFSHLSADYYAGKSVLEVGCGAGCNLMSLEPTAAELVGIEPVPVYVQMSDILCERENRPRLDIRPGSGEQLPFSDCAYDVVLCVTAHQYMDVQRAIHEMARVVKPGGELQIVGPTLDTYVLDGAKPVFRGSFSELKSYVKTILNTLSYTAYGKRIVYKSGEWSTASPVYPMAWQMHRWMKSAGLQMKRPTTRFYPEAAVSFEKS